MMNPSDPTLLQYGGPGSVARVTNPSMMERFVQAEQVQSRPQDQSEGRYVYRDFSHLPADAPELRIKKADDVGIKLQKLPAKLNRMLSDPELNHIITWMPHGRSWKILRPRDFTEQVLPQYFESVNYNSFVRLVNAWGFRRFTTGRDSNAYYHELFLKDMPHLHAKMRRLPKKAKKAPIGREDEPDFYALDKVSPLPGSECHRQAMLEAALPLAAGAPFATFGGAAAFPPAASFGFGRMPNPLAMQMQAAGLAGTSLEEQHLQRRLALMRDEQLLLQEEARLSRNLMAERLQLAQSAKRGQLGGAAAGMGMTGSGFGFGLGLGDASAQLAAARSQVMLPQPTLSQTPAMQASAIQMMSAVGGGGGGAAAKAAGLSSVGGVGALPGAKKIQ